MRHSRGTPLWMVVDKDRTPINGCTGLSRDRADDECADLNANAWYPEFGPFRVVEDVVAMDLG